MLEITNISKSFSGPSGAVKVLCGLSLSVAAGEVVAVHGSSGCGKTTLLLTAGGLLRPGNGEVLINGTNPYLLSNDKRSTLRAAKVGFVFQQFYLIPYLNVADNVLAAEGVGGLDAAVSGKLGQERAKELLKHFNLSHRIDHYPEQLSTGEKQRVALARAVFNKPEIILADEPTGNLDEKNAQVVLEYLSEFAGNGGAVLVVSHDSKVSQFSNRSVCLSEGECS